ncbi:helix-turn-helix domain-containing protein [Clostridium formicaceticum]|uniref:Antitoxin HipB n=1 Tax=Clostridium formicaceticum TaxID=1497 RepID=A0AAC9RIZ8_9CLOT|nr:helix-turn-helix transcriptional regulator [Clostridium formicaceticum]AOY77398.1 hypothetical protein BJL90_16990 [Clostridium formicaceticum]ARE87949.1 Antitoxin HipB [Clostridium formicaceticum]
MPFKKIDAKKMLQDKIEKDKEFAKTYEEVKKEYTLIQQVIKARKEMGLTQKELANKVGVTQQVISRFENEKNAPTLDNLIKILDGLDLEISISKKKDYISI